jgi:hypothetical protein
MDPDPESDADPAISVMTFPRCQQKTNLKKNVLLITL